MKKGIAINTLGIMIILLVTLIIILAIIMQVKSDGSNVISNFFGVIG